MRGSIAAKNNPIRGFILKAKELKYMNSLFSRLLRYENFPKVFHLKTFAHFFRCKHHLEG